MLRLLPHDDDDDDSRDDLIFEISMEFSRKLPSFFFSPVFKKNSAGLYRSRKRDDRQSFVLLLLLLLSKRETLSSSRKEEKGQRRKRIHTERTRVEQKSFFFE